MVDRAEVALPQLEPSRQFGLLAAGGGALSVKTAPVPSLTGYTEAAVAAAYCNQLVIDIRFEIRGGPKRGTRLRDMIHETCRELVAAYEAENDA